MLVLEQLLKSCGLEVLGQFKLVSKQLLFKDRVFIADILCFCL